jgi:hypothetical protein
MTNSDLHYKVGTHLAWNKFQAAHHAAKTNQEMQFVMYDTAFDKADWSQEPALSWDTLLDLRAKQIAAKNKPIVFYFSGGTDSLTIYEVFKRNNIHIDVVWMRAWSFGDEQEAQIPVRELMQKDFYDKHTKIIVQDGDELMANKAYSSEDWIWDQGMRYQYGIIGSDLNSNNEVAQYLGTDDFIAVIGFEKPRLLFNSDGVFSYQDDENYVRPMADPRFDCFFISPDLPELHIKQSYMMLNYILSKEPGATNPAELAKYNNFHNATKFHWHEYSIAACGRFGDINYSEKAHAGNAVAKFYLPKNGRFAGYEYRGRALVDYLKFRHRDSFKNYTNGVMSVANDPAGKYLLVDPNNFYSMRQYTSKHYRLKFK